MTPAPDYELRQKLAAVCVLILLMISSLVLDIVRHGWLGGLIDFAAFLAFLWFSMWLIGRVFRYFTGKDVWK